MGKFRYCLASDYIFQYDCSSLFINSDMVVLELKWGKIYKDRIVIYSGYAWNGVTGPFWEGKRISDGFGVLLPILEDWSECLRETTVATLLHDFVYQFLKRISVRLHIGYEIVKKFADVLFKNLLVHFDFIFSKPYYWGVILFGKFKTRLINIFCVN